ncbi:MAG TPA: DUF4097 family beta strand repeat-containing protein [Phycisphaerales bacterium]|nr:DUF4097 family beta strand repeat-containing protein [Phycisphaerales bacterium]
MLDLRPLHLHVLRTLALLALLAFGPLGCTTKLGMKTGQIFGVNGPFQIEDFNVDVSGPVSVDISTFAGDVTVNADQDITGAHVRIIREATHGKGRKTEAKASLQNISTNVEIVPGELGQMIKVTAVTADPEPDFQRAHVILDIGSLDGLSIQTANGDVEAYNFEGALNVGTSYGGIRLATNHALIRPISLIDHNGSIDLRMRGESEGILDCETIRGTVTHIVKYGKLIINNGTDDDTLHAVLNDGTNSITIRTTDGDIRVAVVSNPTAVGTFIFN